MKKVVYYKMGAYLPHTEAWIYQQIKDISAYKVIFYCHGLCNLNAFSLLFLQNLNIRKALPGFGEKVINLLYRYYSLPKALRDDRPDLIHAHFGPAGYSLLRYKRRFGIPMITTFYGYDLSMHPYIDSAWRYRYSVLFAEGDLFLTEGAHMRQSLIKLGCPPDKVRIQHLGIDLNDLPFMPRTLLPDQSIRILIAGRFCEKKGMPYALAAVGICKQRYPSRKMSVTVIGDSSGELRENKEKRKILQVVKEYDLAETVCFMGYQSHDVFVKELYQHHIFLSPSVIGSDGDAEGGAPFSIIEASASGMPVVSTWNCDIPDVILDAQTGALARERDSEGLADKLGMIMLDPGSWERIGMAGRKHIQLQYNSRVQAKLLEDLYDNVLGIKPT